MICRGIIKTIFPFFDVKEQVIIILSCKATKLSKNKGSKLLTPPPQAPRGVWGVLLFTRSYEVCYNIYKYQAKGA